MHDCGKDARTTAAMECEDSVLGLHGRAGSGAPEHGAFGGSCGKAREALKESGKELSKRRESERVQRLKLLGELAAGVAHEVNNPLMVIMGRSQLALMEQNGLSQNTKKDLEVIVEECKKAREIIKRMLRFARPGGGGYSEINVNKTLEEIVEIVRNQFKLDNVEIEMIFASDLPLVMADEKQMHEVLMNLLNNAKHAVGGAGVIEVSTVLAGDLVRIDVKDNGCGMDAYTLSRIFEPFYTTHRKGTGLGVPISSGIVKEHGGDLVYESNPGKGTTASILLPAAKRTNA